MSRASSRPGGPLLSFIFIFGSSLAANAAGEQPPPPQAIDASAPGDAELPSDAAAPAPAPPPVRPDGEMELGAGNEVAPNGNADGEKKGKKKKKDKDGAANGISEGGSNVRSNYGVGEIKLGGWIFGRADFQQLDRTTVDSMGIPVAGTTDPLDLSLASARFRLDYLSPWEWLTGQIEMEFAGKPDIRDGYVQAKGEHVSFRMGQFKMPVLALQMESPWQLPIIRRGLIHDLTVDWLDVAGRLPGAMVTLRGKFGDIKPRLYLGAFQARRFAEFNDDGSRDTDLIRERDWGSQHLVARGQVDIGSVEIGVVYEHRLASPSAIQLRRLWTAGGDVTVNHVFATGGLRIWVDGLAGASWYELASKPADGEDATFIAARALVAYRFGGVVPAAPYIEPYAFGGVLDPDVDITSDLAWEASVGVNVGFYNRARVTLQGEIDRAQRNFPPGFLAGVSPDRLALIAQVGLAY